MEIVTVALELQYESINRAVEAGFPGGARAGADESGKLAFRSSDGSLRRPRTPGAHLQRAGSATLSSRRHVDPCVAISCVQCRQTVRRLALAVSLALVHAPRDVLDSHMANDHSLTISSRRSAHQQAGTPATEVPLLSLPVTPAPPDDEGDSPYCDSIDDQGDESADDSHDRSVPRLRTCNQVIARRRRRIVGLASLAILVLAVHAYWRRSTLGGQGWFNQAASDELWDEQDRALRDYRFETPEVHSSLTGLLDRLTPVSPSSLSVRCTPAHSRQTPSRHAGGQASAVVAARATSRLGTSNSDRSRRSIPAGLRDPRASRHASQNPKTATE